MKNQVLELVKVIKEFHNNNWEKLVNDIDLAKYILGNGYINFEDVGSDDGKTFSELMRRNENLMQEKEAIIKDVADEFEVYLLDRLYMYGTIDKCDITNAKKHTIKFLRGKND